MVHERSQVLCLNQSSQERLRVNAKDEGSSETIAERLLFALRYMKNEILNKKFFFWFKKMMPRNESLIHTMDIKVVKRNFDSHSSSSVWPGWVSWLLLINWFCLTFCDAVKIDTTENRFSSSSSHLSIPIFFSSQNFSSSLETKTN